MRTIQHVIETKAVKHVLNTIPDYCVVRDLSERDYGIDLMIELFDKTGQDKNGYDKYDSTGEVCYLQIKGTSKELKVGNGNISFSIKKKALIYVEKFSTPFILVRVSTDEKSSSAYFLWLQRYISDVLDFEQPEWRSLDSVTIYIPEENCLSGNFQKIEKIAMRIKYIEELTEFSERFFKVENLLNSILDGNLSSENIDDLRKELNRISKLNTLLSNNTSCIDKESVMELIDFVVTAKDENMSLPESLDQLPNFENLKTLCESNIGIRFIEELEAENDGYKVY